MVEKILEKIDRNREQILEFAKRLISFETPDPPAHNTWEIQEWFDRELQKLGMETRMIDLYPGEPLLVGILKGSKGGKTLTFNGHVDVAQINEDEKWDFDPFSAWWDKRFLYGRGADDMKAGLAAAWFAIKLVHESGVKLENNIMLQSVVGEEAGEHGTKKLIEEGYRGDFVIIPEPTEMKICGQGGVVTVWVVIKSPKTFHDGVRAKMIHAGGGIEGASAIEKMAKILQGMQDLERHWGVTKSYPGMAPGSCTINPSVIKGGRHPAFVADECSLWYTIHYLPNEKMEEVEAEISSYIKRLAEADPWLKDNPPELIFGGTSMFRDKGEIFPASEVPEDNEDTKLLFKTYREVLGKEPESIIWPCVSDSGWFTENGVPVVICGPGKLEDAHTINEKIAIDDVLAAAKLYAAYILAFCGE